MKEIVKKKMRAENWKKIKVKHIPDKRHWYG